MTNQWQRWKGIMKCVPFEEKRLLKWQPPFIIQPKYDGFRCRAIPIQTGPKGDEYLLLSSEENIFYSVPHLNEILSGSGLKAELDGELYNHEMYKEGGFDLLSSVISRTVNLHPDHGKMQFHIFDIVNDQPQMRRQLIVENLRGFNPWIPVAPFWLCESLEDVMRTYDKIIELGYEGIIVRYKMGAYERKRSTMMMKFKPKKEDIYEIIGYSEEMDKEGNPKGRLGSLHCRSQRGDNFSVGSGLIDSLRESLWREAHNLINKRVRVQYQHLTSGKKVPRFPIFMEVIEDE